MSRVFISHSRQDGELTRNVAALLRNIGETAVVMEYLSGDEASTPPYEAMRKEIASADYIMLFKTDNAIRSDYTKNWIVFEVGLAAAANKRLFVFERRGRSIQFPIPYVTDYMLFDPTKVADILQVQSIAKDLKAEIAKKSDEEMSIGFGLLALFAPELFVVLLILGGVAQALAGPIPVACGRCKSSYRYYASVLDAFQCPVCLAHVDPLSELDDKTKNLLQELRKQAGLAGP